jgi:hypothetical protein
LVEIEKQCLSSYMKIYTRFFSYLELNWRVPQYKFIWKKNAAGKICRVRWNLHCIFDTISLAVFETIKKKQTNLMLIHDAYEARVYKCKVFERIRTQLQNMAHFKISSCHCKLWKRFRYLV